MSIIAGRKGEIILFIVDNKDVRYIDCKQCVATVRAAVCRRYSEPNPHGAGSGAVFAGGRAGDKRTEKCASVACQGVNYLCARGF